MNRVALIRLVLFVLVVVIASFVVQTVVHEGIHLIRSDGVTAVCSFGLRFPQEGWISFGWVTAEKTDPNADMAFFGGLIAQFFFVITATILYAFKNPEVQAETERTLVEERLIELSRSRQYARLTTIPIQENHWHLIPHLQFPLHI